MQSASAQLAPILTNGYLDYQYRLTDGASKPTGQTHQATLNTEFSSFIWRPWIAQLHGRLGLTRRSVQVGDRSENGNVVTGRLQLDVFRQSHFPFMTYYESQDSSVGGDVSDIDLATTIFGISQGYTALRGGSYSLDFEKRDSEEQFTDGFQISKRFQSDQLRFTADKTLGRNSLNLKSLLDSVDREAPDSTLRTIRHTMQHRYSGLSRFSADDTTLFSSEVFDTDTTSIDRRFFQFNGTTTWRPEMEKPLLIRGRALVQGADSTTNGTTLGNDSLALGVTANYQYTSNTYLTADVGFTDGRIDGGEDNSLTFQRIHATYRSDHINVLRSRYFWSGDLGVGNRSGDQQDGSTGSVQSYTGGFNHGIIRDIPFAGEWRLELRATQRLTSYVETDDQEEHAIQHGVFATLTNRSENTSQYIRLSTTDRRSYGEQHRSSQLFNLQASMSARPDRRHSWSGSMTAQYGQSSLIDIMDIKSNSSSISYSADLTYRHSDLFDVRFLNFSSELRLISNNFETDDPFDNGIDQQQERVQSSWRNRIEYRVGLLQLRLWSDLRKVDDIWSTQLTLNARRYFGAG